MTNYTIEQIAAMMGATRVGKKEASIQFLLTDSRSVCFPENTLFFAIKTDKGDGTAYIPDLIEKGVRSFVVSTVPTEVREENVNFLVVNDVKEALQRLARRHRQSFNIPVVGITGSNGKTIVKEWLYELLQPRAVTRSPRSYNSQIGVPLSLWLIDEKSEIAIIEAGISQVGEMARLQDMIAPEIGIFTFLGDAHQENFSSMEEKCMEKLSLFRSAKKIIIGIDNPVVRKCLLQMQLSGEVLSWSNEDEGSTLFVKKVEKNGEKSTVKYRYEGKDAEFTIPFTSASAVENSVTCALAALQLGLTTTELAERMPRLEPVEMRLNVVEGKRNITIINDSYNSDINSLSIALDFMHRRAEGKGRKRVVILSDIFEAGDEKEALYTKVNDLLGVNEIDIFIGIGDDLCDANALFTTVEKHFFHSVEAFLFSPIFRSLHDEVILLKGARRFGFERIEEVLVEKVHETMLEVNLGAVVENLNFFRKQMGAIVRMTCMIKADAYGAGAVEIAKTLQENHVDYLAVAVADEGVTLRRHGITQNIMVMNPEMSSFKTLFDYDLEPEIYSFRLLDALVENARKAGVKGFPCHIKLDTGMCRLGFDPRRDLTKLIATLSSQSEIIPRSVFSHFVGADAGSRLAELTRAQFELFCQASEQLQSAFQHKILRHICNSAGILLSKDYHLDMCRLGIGLYGINPLDNSMINNVATLKTVILQIRPVAAGQGIGYGQQTVVERDSQIAVVPIGYADGVNRHLGNRNAYCMVKGQYRADYVGNICMDICMIDVTGIDCKEGDSVEIFGENLPVTVLSDRLETIPYEVLTSVSSRVKRVYFKE